MGHDLGTFAGRTRPVVIYLLIGGRLALAVAGQLDLPKEPPFTVITPGEAVQVSLQLEPESPDSIRLFDAWYWKQGRLLVVAGDGNVWLEAFMRCVRMTKHQGIQASRAWSPPVRRHAVRGESSLYRPDPRFNRIARDVHSYVLAAECYAWAPSPAIFNARNPMREHAHNPH